MRFCSHLFPHIARFSADFLLLFFVLFFVVAVFAGSGLRAATRAVLILPSRFFSVVSFHGSELRAVSYFSVAGLGALALVGKHLTHQATDLLTGWVIVVCLRLADLWLCCTCVR